MNGNFAELDGGYTSDAAAAFSPAQLSGVVAWYEASPTYCFSNNGGTTPCGIGDGNANWQDRSPLASKLLQSSSTLRPTLVQIGGLYYAIRGDGVDDFMKDLTFTSAVKLWCCCVNRIDTTGNVAGISTVLADQSADTRNVRTNSSTKYRGYSGGSAVNSGDANDHSNGGDLWVNKTLAGSYALGTPHVVTSQRGTPTSYVSLNILIKQETDRNWHGEIYGIVGVTSTLTTTERNNLETYLGNLAGLSI